jgi:hypothetical protein
MTRIVLPIAVLTTMLALSLPAQAQLTRTFVSAAGNDSNPCTITQPCQSFAHAYSLTAANGIIAALDPGKYGPLTITGPITINGNGWAAITAPAAGNGITITAGASDNVALIGIEIDRAGAGYNGIVLNAAGSLTVTNCTVQNFVHNGNSFTGNGILLLPTSGAITFAITNTVASNNGWVGIYYLPPSGSATTNGTIDHVVTSSNHFGIGISPQAFQAGGATAVAISNSIASNNLITGIFAAANSSAALTVSIDNTSASGNQTGIFGAYTANVFLSRSAITANSSEGVLNQTSSNTFYSYQNNSFNGNGTDITGALNYTRALQ